MIFFKPLWIKHEDSRPIFSVDIHPKGDKFATGGQGGSGGRIVIWNIIPIISEDDEKNSKLPKMLCQMDNHLACVNVVRWSNAGHLLASGGDDKLVMIWRLTNEGSSAVFGSGKVNVETWKCLHTLNSHNGDVLDLAWASHDGWLASSSVDNSVIIWNAQKFPEKVSILKGHTGMVKGVTWDPVGKYIASQSDDKSLRIWRTSDWLQEEVVTDAFVDCSATTHVLRLSWSPDGQYLVSSHAMNGGGPTAQIIEREGWRQDKDFVGHRKAVTCVRFNSNILKKVSKGTAKLQQYCCCAIGSRDRSISVWLTSLKRPLVVIKDLFDDSVLDISWSSNGLYLLACSWDGTLACIMFTQEEIGTPLSLKEKNDLYERVYHKSLQNNFVNSNGSQIVENAEILNEDEEMIVEKSNNNSRAEIFKPLIMDDSSKSTNNKLVPANKQVETRLPSGKRRITPVLLVSNTLIDTDTIKNNSPNSEPNDKLSFSTSFPTKSKIMIETISDVKENTTIESTMPIISKSTDANVVTMRPPGTQISQLTCCDVPGDLPVVQYISIIDPVKAPAGTTYSKCFGTLKIQVINNYQKTNKGPLTLIEVYRIDNNKKPLWNTYLGSSIRCLAANKKMIVVCCEECSINCFDIQSGGKILPPLIIESAVSSLTLSQNSHCLVLTSTGLIYMWDFNLMKNILSRVSIRSLFINNKACTVISCTLNDFNCPIVALSDGRAYSYSLDLQTWIQISNPLDPLSKANRSLTKNCLNGLPLSSLQTSMPFNETNESLPPSAVLSFLENQVKACLTLRSYKEYKYWIMEMVNHLLDNGPECRLRLILDDLLGPTHSSAKKQKLDENFMGSTRKCLLNELLLIIKNKLAWQRLYNEYNEQLSLQ